MSTKLTIENPLDWRSRALLAESEEARLRAENERLRSWSKAAQEAFERGHRLEDEVERYQALLRETLEIWHEEEGKLRAEVERLRIDNQNLQGDVKWILTTTSLSSLRTEVGQLRAELDQDAKLVLEREDFAGWLDVFFEVGLRLGQG